MHAPPRAPSLVTGACIALIGGFCCSFASSDAHAATRRVPSQYPTIQSAIDASISGDTVLVAPGVYSDRSTRTLVGGGSLGTVTALAFLSPGVTLVSELGAGSTTLDGLDETVDGVVIFGGKTIRAEREGGSQAAGPVPDLGDPRSLRPEDRDLSVPVEAAPAWFPGEPIYHGHDVSYADVQVGKGSGGADPATLEGFAIVNTRYTVYVGGSANMRVASNVFTNGIWVEGTATGLIEGNRLSRGGLYCGSRGTGGLTWRENEFEVDAIDLGCRCRQATWEGNTFANRGRTLFAWALAADDFVNVIGNTFEESFFDGEGGRHIIKGNVLRGPGYGVGLFYLGDGIVEENTVEAYSIGLDGDAEMRYNTTRQCATGADLGRQPFHHNTILDSGNFGIRGSGRQVIEDNEIRGSRLGGIWVEGANASTVRRNLVWENGDDGLRMSAGEVENNVIVMNGGNGICRGSCLGSLISDVAIDPVVLRGNTLAFNAKAGIWIGPTPTRSVEIIRNISAFNDGEGIVCGAEPPSVIVGCNDVFGNKEGDYVDFCSNFSELDGNFSADPLFCDPAENSYELAESSPCAPNNTGACGLIGALSVGCITPDKSSFRPPRLPQRQTSTWGQIKTTFVR
jgi:Right handed beta helix region